jgi:transcription termination factor Rho
LSIIDRASLEQSPLADLHAIASELSIDGYRRLRKEELIEAILNRQESTEGGRADEPQAEEAAGPADEPPARRRRGRRASGRSRTGSTQEDEEEADARAEGPREIEAALEGATGSDDDRPSEEPIEGVVELLAGGAAFVRVSPPGPSDQDVYVSAAQVRRCELVSGDRISGPGRPPRRSERFPSLVRIDTINGVPASEVADSTRFEDLPAAFPSERFSLDSDDPTIKLIAERLPIGRGSRVSIVGERQAGKTEALRRLAVALATQDGIDIRLVLAGVRPEEITEWGAGPLEPTAMVSMAASAEAQVQAVEGVIEQARRLAARGAHAVVLIDTLEMIPAPAARRILAAARNLVDGASLTVIATGPAALGGETSVIALDAVLARAGKFPAVDLDASWTMRAELLGSG